MIKPTIEPADLWQRLIDESVHIIDVRAPVEFTAGSIPLSVNHPILNDAERTLVGTTYKQEGSEKAVAQGHQLISGEVKSQRVDSWIAEVSKNPEKAIVTCFRGGMRSQITQGWLAEKGYVVPRVAGGYKKMRQFLIDQIVSICSSTDLIVLTGKTGAGKTELLKKIKDYPVIDLEFLAKHRGSAFGAYPEGQPSQIDFENRLALELGRLIKKYPGTPVLIEDESRLIGRCVLPDVFFEHMRSSPVLVLNESLETRVENTFQEYVVARINEPDLFEDLQMKLNKVRNKLGGLRHSEISADLQKAAEAYKINGDISLSRVWIEKLIAWYYDPMYQGSFEKRDPRILSTGNASHILSTMSATLNR